MDNFRPQASVAEVFLLPKNVAENNITKAPLVSIYSWQLLFFFSFFEMRLYFSFNCVLVSFQKIGDCTMTVMGFLSPFRRLRWERTLPLFHIFHAVPSFTNDLFFFERAERCGNTGGGTISRATMMTTMDDDDDLTDPTEVGVQQQQSR